MRLLTLLAVVVLTPYAHAQGVPSPPNATVPAAIRLVGTDALGAPDPAGQFTVIMRDLANNPLPGVTIRVDFLPCSGVSLCPTQGPMVTAVHCDANGLWIEGVSGQDGSWSTAIVGCSRRLYDYFTLANLYQPCASQSTRAAESYGVAAVPAQPVDRERHQCAARTAWREGVSSPVK